MRQIKEAYLALLEKPRSYTADKLKAKMQMDDRTFQANLLDTQVMLTKDHNKWNFETLQDLVEGPFHNPKRMEEAIKVSRYVKKLMSFFHPFAHRFSDLSAKTKVDCSVLVLTLRWWLLVLMRDGSIADEFALGAPRLLAPECTHGKPGWNPVPARRRVLGTACEELRPA